MNRPACLLALALFAGPAFAQSFNFAVGPTTNQPSSSYAAAGLPGYWNAFPAPNGSDTYNLVQLDGTVTNVYAWQGGGTFLLNSDDPGTNGDDQQLMDHCQITYTSTETCLFFYNMQAGDYEILMYAWMPNQPTVISNTSSDNETGFPHIVVGGAWPGHQAEGITFARHLCHVSNSDNTLKTHSGIVPGQNQANGAAYNGIQIRQLPPRLAGDVNCDGVVNANDIAAFIQALTAPATYYAAHPTCRIDNADMNNDGQRTPADVGAFVTAVLAS